MTEEQFNECLGRLLATEQVVGRDDLEHTLRTVLAVQDEPWKAVAQGRFEAALAEVASRE